MRIEKVLTDNPYVDEMVYYVKILSFDCVIKSEKLALEAETVDSLKESSQYLSCVNNTAEFDLLTYPIEVLIDCGFTEEQAKVIQYDYSLIPENKKAIVFEKGKQYIIDHYIEKNNYYRMLNGLPNYGTAGIKITNWTPPEDTVIDLNKYIHEMNELELEILDFYGILEQIKSANPTLEYLKHLGAKSVNYIESRQASDFEVLYLPNIESKEIYDRFKEKLDINRKYIKRTVYSDAFAYGSDYYDNMIIVLIVVSTMLDMFSEIQEFIARKEILNLRCVQYIFESYGIPYYSEIPLKYQIAMVKNLNTLLKYKSTSRNMVDICSLFGFDNIEVFKYYLLKERVMDDDGNFVFYYLDNGEEDVTRNYNLKFVRVPLEDQADGYIRDPSNHLNYDDVVSGDDTWDGDRDHSELKNEILNQEFNYARTKYVSIDNVYEITQMAFQMPYFFNMIFDNVKNEELLTLSIPYLSNDHKFKMTDIFAYLYSLTYIFYDLEDEIMDTDELDRVLYVTGFNFTTDMQALAQYVAEKGFTLEELGVSGFMIPDTSIMSYNQLMEIFVKNGNIRDHLVRQIINADNKEIYDIYYKLYNSLMITKFTNDYFRNPATGKIFSTYTDYISSRDNILFQSITDIKAITDEEQKIQSITSTINNVVSALDQYIDTAEYKYIYSNLPSVSSESVKAYVIKVIDFFKSYKIDFLGMNTIYKFDDKLDNTVKIIDEVDLIYVFYRDELVKYFDHTHTTSTINAKDKMSLIEDIHFDISRWAKFEFSTDIGKYIKEIIVGIYVKMLKNENVEISDMVELLANINYKENNSIVDMIVNMINNFTYIDRQYINDYIDIIIVSMLKSTMVNIKDSIASIEASKTIHDITAINDGLATLIATLIRSSRVTINSIIVSLTSYFMNLDYMLVSDSISISNNIITSDYSIILDSLIMNIYKNIIEKFGVKFTHELMANSIRLSEINILDNFSSNIVSKTPNMQIDYIDAINSYNAVIKRHSKLDIYENLYIKEFFES